MAGLRKAKKYDWKDSNLALFGSDTEKNVKKESAREEKAWKGAGMKPGLRIWRIVQFKVTDWPQEDYGKFYNGDSYIILNTYKKSDSDELLYDVHFWIGANSTQDEYGTAAYKTVELDTLLDDKPIQHREVEKYESDLFKSYFKSIRLLEGGADSGFKHVTPEKYEPRLLRVTGDKNCVELKQVERKMGNLKDDDTFILDDGLKIYMWHGPEANKDEKFRAVQIAQELKSERGGKPHVETLDDKSEIAHLLPDGASQLEDQPDAGPKVKCLFKLSDASGTLNFCEVASGGAVKKSLLSSDDVFILDTGNHCYVWTGRKASIEERRNAMTYAHNYLMKTEHPFLPVTAVNEGKETAGFHHAF